MSPFLTNFPMVEDKIPPNPVKTSPELEPSQMMIVSSSDT